MKGFSHLSEKGEVTMVEITDKEISQRYAHAQGSISMAPETIIKIQEGTMHKKECTYDGKNRWNHGS